MRHYELVVVLSPMISPDEAGQAWERIKGYLTNREAEIVHEERWGTRRLAYPVRKGQYQFLEGNYHLTRFTTEQSFNRELETYLKLDDNVLRSLVTSTVSEEEIAAHAAQTRAPRPPRPPVGVAPAGAPAGAPATPPAPEGSAAPAAVADAPAEAGAPAAVAEGAAPAAVADAPAPAEGEAPPAVADPPQAAAEEPAAAPEPAPATAPEPAPGAEPAPAPKTEPGQPPE